MDDPIHQEKHRTYDELQLAKDSVAIKQKPHGGNLCGKHSAQSEDKGPTLSDFTVTFSHFTDPASEIRGVLDCMADLCA